MHRQENVSATLSLFSILFLSFYFLLLFLVENKYILWAIPPLTLLYLGMIFYKIRRYPQEIDQKSMLAASGVCLYVCLLFGLSFQSISIPLSLHRWVTLALGGLTFSTFFAAPHISPTTIKTLLTSTVLVHALFVPLGLCFLVFKTPLEFLPANSLLTFLVGQNHAYILYLYSLPIAGYYWMRSKYRWPWAVVCLLFIIGVVVSFSRFGLTLLTLELFLLWKFFLKDQKGTPQRVSRILTALFGVIVIYGSALFIFSAVPQLSFGDNCKAPLLTTQLCKSFAADRRVEYWLQAWRGFLDKPVTGNGGDTLGLISLKYRKLPNQYSSFAHNDYLQLLTEYGVFGAGMIFVYTAVLFWAFKRWSTTTLLTKSLLISVGIISIDALINFNWMYSSIFLFHCFLLAITLRTLVEEGHEKSQQQNNKPVTVLFLTSLIAAALPVFWFSGKFMIAETFFGKDPEEYISTFPYSQSVARTAYRSSDVSNSVKEEVFRLYKNEPSAFKFMTEEKFQVEDQFTFYREYLNLDPLDLEMRVKYISTAIRLNEPVIVEENIRWLKNYYPLHEKHQIIEEDFLYLEKLIEYANQLSTIDPELARKITVSAYHFEPWRANEIKTVFLLQPKKYTVKDVNAILEVLPKDLWGYQESLSEWSLDQAVQSAQKEEWHQLQRYVELNVGLNQFNMYLLWEKLFPHFSQKIRSLDQKDPAQYQRKASLIKSWRDTLASIRKFDTVGFATSEWSKQIDAFE